MIVWLFQCIRICAAAYLCARGIVDFLHGGFTEAFYGGDETTCFCKFPEQGAGSISTYRHGAYVLLEFISPVYLACMSLLVMTSFISKFSEYLLFAKLYCSFSSKNFSVYLDSLYLLFRSCHTYSSTECWRTREMAIIWPPSLQIPR